jgi:hypothetical protein
MLLLLLLREANLLRLLLPHLTIIKIRMLLLLLLLRKPRKDQHHQPQHPLPKRLPSLKSII